MKTIYFDEKSKQYYYDGDEVCTICKQTLSEIFFIKEAMTKKRFITRFLCESCIGKSKTKGILTAAIGVLKRPIPVNALPIALKPMNLKARSDNETIFTMADKNDNCEVLDHTRIAGRETIEDGKIGIDINKVINNIDNPVKDIDLFLADIEDSEPIIINQPSKQLNSSSVPVPKTKNQEAIK